MIQKLTYVVIGFLLVGIVSQYILYTLGYDSFNKIQLLHTLIATGKDNVLFLEKVMTYTSLIGFFGGACLFFIVMTMAVLSGFGIIFNKKGNIQ